ncbi:MAG: lamin tail domain-containing protein, partial [Promethearchaeota archaeon]
MKLIQIKKRKSFIREFKKHFSILISLLLILFIGVLIVNIQYDYSTNNSNSIEEKNSYTPNKIYTSNPTEAVNVCITEIYVDGSDWEWIEIYNPKDTAVDVTNWEIVDGGYGSSGQTEVRFSDIGLTSIGPGQVIMIGDDWANTDYNDTVTFASGE